jgi:hypothetical protein
VIFFTSFPVRSKTGSLGDRGLLTENVGGQSVLRISERIRDLQTLDERWTFGLSSSPPDVQADNLKAPYRISSADPSSAGSPRCTADNTSPRSRAVRPCLRDLYFLDLSVEVRPTHLSDWFRRSAAGASFAGTPLTETGFVPTETGAAAGRHANTSDSKPIKRRMRPIHMILHNPCEQASLRRCE